MPESPSYARRVFTRAFRETAGFTNRKLLVGVCMAVLVRLALWRFHQVKLTWADVWADLLIIVGSYATVVLASFLWNLFRAPALLDKEWADKTAALTGRLQVAESLSRQLENSKLQLEVQRLEEEKAARAQRSRIDELAERIQALAAQEREKQQANSPFAVLSEDEICQALSVPQNDVLSALLILKGKELAKRLDAGAGLWAVR